MKKSLQYGLLSALVIGITACGGSSGSKPTASIASSSGLATSSVASSSVATVATTTYTVSVDVPTAFQTAAITVPQRISQFLIASAYAAEVSQLTAANFAVVIVDLAGNVRERVQLTDTDISKNPDGTWSLAVPGDPRLDCVIVADVTKPIVLQVDGNINQSGFVFAPTTAESVDIDVGSTAAYKNFIEELGGTGTFEDLAIDPTDTQQIKAVENLVNTIQIVVADQPLTDYSNIADALAAIKATVEDTVKQEVLNVKSPAQGTAVTLIRDEGGLFYFDGGDADEIGYGSLKGDEEVDYEFDGSSFVKVEDDDSDSGSQLVLSSNGWQLSADATKVASFNDDGTVTLQDVAADGLKEIAEVTQVFNLAGRNIKDYLTANPHTTYLGKLTNPESTFAEGAKGYKVRVSVPDTSYWIYYEPGFSAEAKGEIEGNGDGDGETNEGSGSVSGLSEGTCPWNENLNASNTGGNCNVVMLHGAMQSGVAAPSELSALFSEDVAPNTTGFVGVELAVRMQEGRLVVQLLNDAAKTERFYLQSWTSNEMELVGQGTWSELTLPGLTEDARVIHIQIPEAIIATSVSNEDEDEDEGESDDSKSEADYYIVRQAGFLRQLYVEEAGLHSEDVGAVFNGEGSANILAALDYEVPPTLLPTATIEVDGDDADWAEVTPYLLDRTGDQNGETSTDLTQVSIAKSGDKVAVLMKVTGDFTFPFAPSREFSHYEVAIHFYSNAHCMGEDNGFLVVNNLTSATGVNSHMLNGYFDDGLYGGSDTPATTVAHSGDVLETSFFFDHLPADKGDYISLTSVIHSFVSMQGMNHDVNYEQDTCYKIR